MASTDRPQLNKGQYIEDKCEQLFLLEVLVDKIKIKTEGLLGSIEAKEEPAVVEEEEEQEEEELTDEEEAERRREEARKRKRKKPITRPIKVKVKFFDFPTIEIDEWDFTEAKEERQRKLDMLKEEEDEETQEEKADDLGLTLEEYQERMKRKKQQIAEELENTMPPGDKFCSGKSCLFPIIPLDLVNAIKKSPLYVQVQRAGDASQGPRVIGRTNIQLGDNFVEAIALASTPTILPVSAFIDGPYNLKNVFGEVTAVVDLYVRISCFGNSIFTQFKLKEGEEDYLFKMSGSNLSDLERINQMNKSKEYGPILNPIFTQSEDFSVGIKAPVLYPIDPNLKPPVSWRKPYDYPKQIPVCPPKKLYRKPRPKVKYRKKIYKDLDLLQEVIPGFGRQLGDPNFVADNPTLPRYSEEINEHDGAKTKEDQFKNAENPGITLPCQFGARWSPLKFPLLTVPRYPPLKDLWRMDLPNVRNLLLPTFREASKIAKIRMSLLEDIFTEDKALKCTCNTLQRGITPLPFSCSCDESLPAYKCEKEFPPSEHTSMIRNKEYAKIPPDPNLNEKIKECVKKKFPIFDNIGYYDQDPLVMTATIEYDTSDSDQYTTITNDGDSPSTFDINMRLIETFNTKKYPFSLRDSGKKNSLDETSGAERTEWIVRRHRMNASNGRTATVYSRAPNVKVGSLSDDNCKCVNKTKKVQETPVQPRNRFDDFSEDEVDEVLLRKKTVKDAKLLERFQKEKEFSNLMEDAREKKRKACAKTKFLLKKIEERRLMKRMEEEEKKTLESKKVEEASSQNFERDLEFDKQDHQELAPSIAEISIKTIKSKELSSTKKVKNLKKLKGKLNQEAPKRRAVKELQKECAKERHISIKYKETDGLYPDKKFGHKTCKEDLVRCPPQFGWMWDYCTEKMRKKPLHWKPDLSKFRARAEVKPAEKPKPKFDPTELSSGKHSDDSVTNGPSDEGLRVTENEIPNEDSDEAFQRYKSLQAGEVPIEPTLHIHKTEGKYYAMLFPPPDPLSPKKFNREDVILFKFDPRHPNDSSDTAKDSDDSTVTEDSYAIDVTCPLGVSKYIPPVLYHSVTTQTIETYAIRSKRTFGSESTATFESSEVEIDLEELDPEKVKQMCQPLSTTSSSSDSRRRKKKKDTVDISEPPANTDAKKVMDAGKKGPVAKGKKGQQVKIYTATLHQTASPFMLNTEENIEELSSDRLSSQSIQTEMTKRESFTSSSTNQRNFEDNPNKKVKILEPIAEINQTIHEPPPLSKEPKTKILKTISKY